MEKCNYKFIDYAKFISAILVVCIHTGPLLSISESANFVLVQTIARMAVPFFFVSSSFFFFSKINYSIGLNDPLNTNHLKRYLSRIFKLYIIWTIIYLPILIYGWIQNGFTYITLIRFLRDLVFCGSYYHLWFLPALIFSVYLVYNLLKKFKIKEIIIMALLFYLIGMLINVYYDFLNQLPIIKYIVNGYLVSFSTARNGMLFAFIFVALGARLSMKKIPLAISTATIPLSIFAILYILETLLLKWLGYTNELTSMYFFLVPLIYYLFLLLMQFQGNANTLLIRKLCPLVYVSHLYFIEIFSRVGFIHQNSIVYFIVVLLATLIFSYIIIKYSKKMKGLKVLY